MTNITELLTENLLVLIGMIFSALLVSILFYLQYRQAVKQSLIEAEARAAAVELNPGSIDNLSNLLVENFRVLNTYYSENLSQARLSSLASILIAIIGFVVIISGILIAIIWNQTVLGTASSAAGIVSEAAAALFFRQNRVFLDQMQDSLKKLVSTQYLMTSVSLSKVMNEEARDEEIRHINQHLRTLMDSLHGISQQK